MIQISWRYVCSFLPKLREWTVSGPRFTLAINWAREWKRICPLLETVDFVGDEELTDEVKEVLQGLGITVILLLLRRRMINVCL
jgi:hypothetical protein